MDPVVLEYLEKLFDSKLEGVLKCVQETNSKIDTNTDVMQKTIGTVKEEVNNLKKQQSIQNTQIENIKMKECRSNLVIHGIKKPNYLESLDSIINIFDSCGIQGTKYCIKSISKLGPGKWEDRPILVSLISNLLKIDILKNKKKIEQEFQVKLKEDLPQNIRSTRKELAAFSKLAIDNKIKCYMKMDKLMVHGKLWSLEELKQDISNSFLNPKRPREEDNSPELQIPKKVTGPTMQTPRARINSIDNYFKINPLSTPSSNQ